MQKKPKIAPEVPSAPFPEQVPIVDPEDPLVPEEGPDFIPEEDPFETPPVEIPPPGEGP
jgi:hypothetical protein